MPETQQPDLVSTLADLHGLMVTTPDVTTFLEQVTRLVARLTDGLSCSITMGSAEPFTVSPTDDLAERVDEVQYGFDAGPCLDAIRTSSVTLVQDLDAEGPWPGYREHARKAGVRSSLSLPLTVTGTTIGGINIYGREPNAFAPRLQDTLAAFAAQAAAALAMVLRTHRQAMVSAQLEEALSSRTVIDQALGILMAQQRCTADEALALLRSHSQNTNRRLRDVAADLIHRVTGAAPVPAAPFAREDAG